jgi:glycosyltransferase involved in cell wall biosynthesis
MERPRRVCIVTNFNYSAFVAECLESILSQTLAFDRIVVVDDGSTDGSREIIVSFARAHSNIQPIFKANGGQLSCFNASVPHVKDGDLLWLIDSDDVFPHDYVQCTDELYRSQSIDFAFVKPVVFSQPAEAPRSCRLDEQPNVYFPITSAVTRVGHSWFGASTSCISLRGAVFLSLFPYPYERDWITRADDVVVFGSSIIGATKLYAPSLGISYRKHDNNSFFGKRFDAAYWVSREFYLERLFGWYEQKFALTKRPSLGHVMREIALVPKKYRKQFLVPSVARLIANRLFGSAPWVISRLLTLRV